MVTGAIDAQGTIFKAFGFQYVGPVNGHDMDHVDGCSARNRATDSVLLHCCTVKGKGYAPTESAPNKYPRVGKFTVACGTQAKKKPNAPSYTKVFGNAQMRLVDDDHRIVGIAAAMPGETGIDVFARTHPKRMFDVGIAEQHGVTFAAGMAASGLKRILRDLFNGPSAGIRPDCA